MQYIPGPESTLAPALEQFMAGLNHAIDPDYKLREAVKQQMALNPELLQNLANAEAKSPGVLSRLGLGKIGDTIAQTPADIKTQSEITNRSAMLEAEKTKVEAGTAKDKLAGQIASAASTTLSDPNSTAAKEIGNVATVGMPSWEMATGQQKQEYMKMTQQIIRDGVPITVKKLQNGEYTPEQLIGIFSSPLGEGLKLMVDSENEKLRRSLMNRQLTADNAMNRLMQNQAFQLYQDTRTGTPQAFMEILTDPSATDRAKRMVADPSLIKTPADQQLVDAYNGVQHLGAAAAVRQNSEVRKNIEAAQASLRSIKPSDPNADALRASAVNDLNSAFENRSVLLGTPRFKAEYKTIEKSFWPDSKEVIYTDESGKPVPENVALGGFRNNPEFDSRVGRTMIELQKVTPTNLDAALSVIKEKDPEVYAAVLARLNASRAK